MLRAGLVNGGGVVFGWGGWESAAQVGDGDSLRPAYAGGVAAVQAARMRDPASGGLWKNTGQPKASPAGFLRAAVLRQREAWQQRGALTALDGDPVPLQPAPR